MLSEIYPGCISLGGPNSGLFLEIGRTAFSTTDTEASIRTQLDEIQIGKAWAYGGSGAWLLGTGLGRGG